MSTKTNKLVIQNAIVHELVKDQFTSIDLTKQIISTSLLKNDDAMVIALTERIHKTYGDLDNSCHYGVFRDDHKGGLFPIEYNNYIERKSINFLDLSKKFMDSLIESAKHSPAASGGYIVCLEYQKDGSKYLTYAMIKKSNEIQFNNKLQPISVTVSDLKKLHQAIRINTQNYISRISNPNTQYLSFLSQDSDGASKYFVEAAGCQKGLTSRTATTAVYSYFKNVFCKHEKFKDEKLAVQESLTNFFNKKYNSNLEATTKDIIAMMKTEHGDKFTQDEQTLKDSFFNEIEIEMNGEKYRIPASFPVSKTVVDRKKQFKYKSDFMDLKIDLSTIDTEDDSSTVYWDKDESRLIIKDDDLKIAIEKQLFEKARKNDEPQN